MLPQLDEFGHMPPCHDREGLVLSHYPVLPIKRISGKARHLFATPRARTGFLRWLLAALHESRSKEAKRIIRRNRHLLSSVADVPTGMQGGSSEQSCSQG